MTHSKNQQNDRSEPVKRAHIFAHQTISEHKTNIKPAKAFTEHQHFVETQDPDSVNEQLPIPRETENPSRSKTKGWWFAFMLLVLLASVFEIGFVVYAAIAQQDWLAGLWLVALFAGVVLFARFMLQEFNGLRQLKKQSQLRTQSEQLANNQVIGRAEQHCVDIANNLPVAAKQVVSDWQSSVQAHHTDNEVMRLFEQKVMTKIDRLAMQQVSNNASAAGVMIAISPFALLDMLIVFWRNIRMMNQISGIYGLKLGYWGRIRLLKNIFNNMIYAGAAEILSDAGNYALGASVTGKLSTRVAQGLGAGVLTARIGLKAIEQSRPMPWLTQAKPGVSGITKQLLTDLRNKVS